MDQTKGELGLNKRKLEDKLEGSSKKKNRYGLPPEMVLRAFGSDSAVGTASAFSLPRREDTAPYAGHTRALAMSFDPPLSDSKAIIPDSSPSSSSSPDVDWQAQFPQPQQPFLTSAATDPLISTPMDAWGTSADSTDLNWLMPSQTLLLPLASDTGSSLNIFPSTSTSMDVMSTHLLSPSAYSSSFSSADRGWQTQLPQSQTLLSSSLETSTSPGIISAVSAAADVVSPSSSHLLKKAPMKKLSAKAQKINKALFLEYYKGYCQAFSCEKSLPDHEVYMFLKALARSVIGTAAQFAYSGNETLQQFASLKEVIPAEFSVDKLKIFYSTFLKNLTVTNIQDFIGFIGSTCRSSPNTAITDLLYLPTNCRPEDLKQKIECILKGRPLTLTARHTRTTQLLLKNWQQMMSWTITSQRSWSIESCIKQLRAYFTAPSMPTENSETVVAEISRSSSASSASGPAVRSMNASSTPSLSYFPFVFPIPSAAGVFTGPPTDHKSMPLAVTTPMSLLFSKDEVAQQVKQKNIADRKNYYIKLSQAFGLLRPESHDEIRLFLIVLKSFILGTTIQFAHSKHLQCCEFAPLTKIFPGLPVIETINKLESLPLDIFFQTVGVTVVQGFIKFIVTACEDPSNFFKLLYVPTSLTEAEKKVVQQIIDILIGNSHKLVPTVVAEHGLFLIENWRRMAFVAATKPSPPVQDCIAQLHTCLTMYRDSINSAEQSLSITPFFAGPGRSLYAPTLTGSAVRALSASSFGPWSAGFFTPGTSNPQPLTPDTHVPINSSTSAASMVD